MTVDRCIPAYCLVLLAACATASSGSGDERPDAGTAGTPDAGTTGTPDAGTAGTPDAGTAGTSDAGTAGTPDAGTTGTPDAGTAGTPDAGTAGTPDAGPSTITGGPCLSGAAGATAYRFRWIGSGSVAVVDYEMNGLPDHSRDHVGAYSSSIGYTPAFGDTGLAEGGLLMGGTNFIDIKLSTAGVTSITSATLSIYGRSYNTSASGSFTWTTFAGGGRSTGESRKQCRPVRLVLSRHDRRAGTQR